MVDVVFCKQKANERFTTSSTKFQGLMGFFTKGKLCCKVDLILVHNELAARLRCKLSCDDLHFSVHGINASEAFGFTYDVLIHLILLDVLCSRFKRLCD